MGAWAGLWAKKPANPEAPKYEETLLGHTQRVCEAAEVLSEMLAPKLLEIARLDEASVEQWRHAVVIAAWMHDWGKANDHFQRMLSDTSFRQGVRHETLTLVLTRELATWLDQMWQAMPAWVRCAALFSASGHHLKFPDPFADNRTGAEVTILSGHKDFASVLRLKADSFGLPVPPILTSHTLSLLRRGEVQKTLSSLERELDADFTDKEKLLIAMTKSTLMAADLGGSALPGKAEDPAIWIKDRLGRLLTEGQLAEVVTKKLSGGTPRAFQVQMSLTRASTVLVEAGCGSGKTAGAYLWASKNAHGKRLFFCYPTTGTASEGFAGYLKDPDFDAILVHSRAEVDYRLLDNMPSPLHEESDLRQARLEALETWPMPAVVCTAHTVLGLLENVRRGIYAFPSLVQSVFVFDEVHAFSERLFSYLLRFLEALPGAPVLLMTATLPPARRQALEECCRRRGGLDIISGPAKREAANRYVVRKAPIEDVWPEVNRCLSADGKALWVCNTVGRAMATLDEALKHGMPVQPYHSRYRYKDRLKRHRTVVDGFLPGRPPMLAVTTQVAEMSLDLSADLLVSEWAPVAAMIQRMGRLNRFEEEPSRLGTVLFVEPESRLPYDEAAFAGAADWLELLADGAAKSQSELAAAFVSLSSSANNDFEPVPYCEWLDGLWRTLKDQRAIEEAGYTVEILREEDLGKASNVEMAIPMPIPQQRGWQQWDRSGRYLVAPSGTIVYDSFRGATWKT